MLFDTHAHVNFKSFKDDAKETLQRALDAGVNVINVGSQIDTSRQAVELANSFEKGVYAVVGLHPEHTHSQYVDEEETHFLSREENFNYEEYKKLAQNGKVVGIGECGLDYYRLPEDKSLHKEVKEKQKAAFRLQLKLAKELNKALVIHSRPEKGNEELFDDLVNILDEEKIGDLRFEVHSFTGSPEALKKFLDRGSHVSFNGIITFDKTGNMEKLVKMAPMDRIILETDCPYLTPVPHRGKRNEPAYVRFVAEHVARVKGLAVEEVERQTTENAKTLFGI
jgi:TatD DNase family protein